VYAFSVFALYKKKPPRTIVIVANTPVAMAPPWRHRAAAKRRRADQPASVPRTSTSSPSEASVRQNATE
jgi:hypothetical protein